MPKNANIFKWTAKLVVFNKCLQYVHKNIITFSEIYVRI